MPDPSASIDEIVEFWDTHSTADYNDEMQDVTFDIDLREEAFVVALVPELAEVIGRAAKARGVTTETLVNLWLAERVKVPA
ncbi:MAG: BrnA antitoxin family protein [Chloroflexi bacterium]|nr:BrnA antitoxin family protein [Chloroflexota bacterium]